MLNPRRLRVLREVLAAGSINAAARNLNYSPATISQHMSALAAETGLKLFERHGRGILATAAARHLADQAGSLLADFERLDRVVADLRGGQTEHLAIACFASAAEEWLPDVVGGAIRAHRPNLTVEISLNEPVDGPGRRRPDLDIRSEAVSGAALRLHGYRRHSLAVEPLVAIIPSGHRLAALPEIPLRELAAEPWVDHDIYDSCIGRMLAGAYEAAGFTPRYAARLDDHRAALRLVSAGVGFTVLPQLAVAALTPDLLARPVVQPSMSRRIVVHVREDPGRRELIARALGRLRKCAKDHETG